MEVVEPETQTKGENRDLKDKLLRRFGSHISSLKLEFSKKKKKGKLPKEARQTLLEWWNVHYRWPYPTVCLLISLRKFCNGHRMVTHKSSQHRKYGLDNG